MSSDKNTTEITLLDRKYLIACPPEEQDDLLRSAQYLNRKLMEIRQGGKILSLDRLVIMAALNITHELLKNDENQRSSTSRIQRLNDQMDNAIGELDALVGSRKIP
ncbi:cell division protein ZapA [Marinospirillum alkaliphilum]|uniref:Cell division protein ZapA n=1 Tax=Marinospirillum alkaliphilum DSM 21637 TaxID=1122209 RepID=A0A1K1WRU2_9GAMM|nr:cell division protein ZapA [Marinospirillum alkaliphilum]SFX39485.1 cell division protein ZapA [Marinospirillum alkaliphilum DSM 21637]